AVVRAIDEDGNQDDNTVEKKGTPRSDHTAPTFAGATSATPKPGGKVEVAWSAAHDDLTATDGIAYRVWVSDASPVDTTGAPAVVTDPGATSASLVLPIPTTTYNFVVHAVDAAGNEDANTHEVSSKPGPDDTAPTFAGCTSAMAIDAGDVAVTWDAAADDTTPAAQIAYTVYAFLSASSNPDVTSAYTQQTFVGTLGGTVGGLHADTTYYFLCRAADLTGNEDENKHEESAHTLEDTSPPTFGGATGVVVDPLNRTGGFVVSWDAATDDQTDPSQITYDVYQGPSAGMEDFGTPVATVVGMTQVTLSMQTPATAGYFVVRAKDLASNEDANANEVNATTYVSFAQNLQPAFSSICTNCHTVQHPPNNTPYLDPGISYDQIIGAGVTIAGDHADSILWQYTSYTPPACPYMPYNDCAHKLTLQQVQWIADWIDQGTFDN
ncbi:MAG TPA: hypothetical protein VHB21_03310, partial [Minicystis sp.]|nr:hypothetical protein [Minicystis sp.]